MGFIDKLFPAKKGFYGKSWPAIAIGLFVAFGGVLFGYDTGTISGILAMKFWRETFSTGHMNADGEPDVSSSQSSLIVSILSAGTFLGALSSPFFADNIGRKWGLFASCWVFNLGVALQTAATALPLFIAGRFFAGFGVGLISAMIPLYQSETAPKWIRGLIVGAYQLAITIGLLLAAVCNNATKDRSDSGSYRIPISIQFLWSLILMIGILVLPETPRYLIKKGKLDKAQESLTKLRRVPFDDPVIADELATIKADYDYEMSLGTSTYLDCFRGAMVKRQLTGIGLQALQQLTGINFIFYYGTTYFKNSGINNPFVITMITSAVNTLSTFPGILSVDKFGRRNLLLCGAIGMAVSQLIVALCGTLGTSQDSSGTIIVKNSSSQKASIAFVCIYIFFFASTWGPLAWVVTGELFPIQFRARALSMTTASNWLLNWAIAYATPYLVDYGPGNANLQSKIFFVWFGCCFFCIAFVYFFIYETKGLTLEQVNQLYHEISRAKDSSRWVPAAEKECGNHDGNSGMMETTPSFSGNDKDEATTHHP